MIAHSEMIALGFDRRVDNLIIEKLRVLRLSCNTPCVVIDQAAQECELALLIEYGDLDEIGELPGKCLNALVEPCEVALNLSPKKRLHAVIRELSPELADGSSRIGEEATDRAADTPLRPCTFEQHHIEDLNLIETVMLRCEEAAALIDCGFDHRIVIAGKGNFRPVRFEEVLVDMESGAESFESCLQALDRIFLFGAIEAFVVDTLNIQNHAQVA